MCFFRVFIKKNILYILYLYLLFFTGFFACNSAFEQGHLEPWRYINAFIIIIILACHPETTAKIFSG